MRVASYVPALAMALVFLAAPRTAAGWVQPLSAAVTSSSSPVLDSPVQGPVQAWPVAPIAPPAEGCVSPALSLVKVVAVVLGALAAIKLPLLLAKLLLAKVLLLLPLALPLALPLLLPVMMLATMLPGMEDSPAPTPAPATPVSPPPSGPAGGGNASPVTPAGDETEARGLWVERCIQRVACQLSNRGSRKECARFHCGALDWMGTT